MMSASRTGVTLMLSSTAMSFCGTRSPRSRVPSKMSSLMCSAVARRTLWRDVLGGWAGIASARRQRRGKAEEADGVLTHDLVDIDLWELTEDLFRVLAAVRPCRVLMRVVGLEGDDIDADDVAHGEPEVVLEKASPDVAGHVMAGRLDN